jgi:hypothetical protein
MSREDREDDGDEEQRSDGDATGNLQVHDVNPF